MKGFFSRLFGGDKAPVVQPPPQEASAQNPNNPNPQEPKKKKGFFGKIAGMFKDDKGSAPESKPPAEGGQDTPHQ
jgi:hypothetical protein